MAAPACSTKFARLTKITRPLSRLQIMRYSVPEFFPQIAPVSPVMTGLLLSVLLFAYGCNEQGDPFISGTVTNAAGEPVSDAEVMIAYYLDLLNPEEEDHSSGNEAVTADRVYLPWPNPVCRGESQTLAFDLADTATVTFYARSFRDLNEYDHLFMDFYEAGRHDTSYQMVPDMYEMNVTFVEDTLVSVVVPEVLPVSWDRGEMLTHCEGNDGYPAEVLDVTDDRGRFSADRRDILWQFRAFWKTSPDSSLKSRNEAPVYRLGTTAAVFVRDDLAEDGTVRLEETDLMEESSFIEIKTE